ncbi:MAG: hypothetical protein A2144_11070 [Chloroflexi bacterium RBG_16_50_9]|nr:MAG: hypothetical protein A2144_11070 [Chloroflexi bacterium RBG_16_50_9]
MVDLAVAPGDSGDNALFMLTFGGKHSLWRSLDSGDTWERVFTSALADVDNIKLVGLPQHGGDNRTLYVAGESGGKTAIWKSTDQGQSFRRRFAIDPATGTPFPIDVWAIVDDATLFVGSYDGSAGLVYQSVNSGFSYSGGVRAGEQSLNSIVLSPDYEQDGTILIGNTDGWLYWSDNNGVSFESLPADATSQPLVGPITVAFDARFDSNRIAYAASDTADNGVYRFIIRTKTDWERIDANLPAGARLNDLVVAPDGALYAANSKAGGGMERCLNPAFTLGPAFETVTRGLGTGAILEGLRQSDHRLWSIDTANNRLMTFNDTLTSPVVLTSPDEKASGIGGLVNHTVRNIRLDWETKEGATTYLWQLNYTTDFSSVPSGFENNAKASFLRLPALEPATTYYWRVRATEPVLSPWSDKRSFTTSLDTEAITLSLESPQAGASGVPVKPVFQWTAVTDADAYELLVSTDPDCNNPSIIKKDDYALATTAWQSDVKLDHDTTYYWKVRAINTNTRSAWSAVGAFTTESATQAPPTATKALPNGKEPLPDLRTAPTKTPTGTLIPAPVPVSPATPPAPIIIESPNPPNWLLYIMGALLLIIVLTLIIILMLVVAIRRD